MCDDVCAFCFSSLHASIHDSARETKEKGMELFNYGRFAPGSSSAIQISNYKAKNQRTRNLHKVSYIQLKKQGHTLRNLQSIWFGISPRPIKWDSLQYHIFCKAWKLQISGKCAQSVAKV